MTSALGALVGAGIAFGFFLLGQAFLKAYDNAKDHRDALVRTERLLNEHLDILHVHQGQIATLRGNIESGRLLIDLPRAMPADEAAWSKLLDIDIVNLLFGLSMLARRINNDVENLRSAYSQLAAQFLGGRLKREEYAANALFVVKGFETVATSLSTYKAEAEQILARVRLHFHRQQRVPMRLVGFLTRRAWSRLDASSDEEIGQELAAIANDVRIVKERGPATDRKRD